MLGLTKRTCHFVFDRGKRRSLYLALVRSNFEHCSIIWRPVNAVEHPKLSHYKNKPLNGFMVKKLVAIQMNFMHFDVSR